MSDEFDTVLRRRLARLAAAVPVPGLTSPAVRTVVAAARPIPRISMSLGGLLVIVLVGLLAIGLAKLPGVGPVTPSANPAACASAATAYEGTVAGSFVSTIAAIRAVPVVADNPQLSAYKADQVATLCYVDGKIGKGPPPPMESSATVPPLFDRAVLVVVDDQPIFIAAGYRDRLPVVGPAATSATPPPSVPATLPTVSPWSAVGPQLGGCVVGAVIWRRFGDLLAICQDGNLQPQVLLSTDGRNWGVNTPVGLAPITTGDVDLLNGLAENASGDLVLVGAEALDDFSSGGAAAWTSSDAIHWHRVDSGPAFRDAEILGVIAAPNGYLAVGDDGFPGGNVQLPSLRQAAIWQGSTDGREWHRLPSPPDASRVQLEGLVGGPNGYVAWGDGAAPGTGAMWTSADGRSWLPVTPPSGGWGPIGRVISVRGGYVAVGAAASGGSSAAGIWTSPNGSQWTTRSPTPSAPPLWDVTALGDVVVAVGDGVTAESDDDGMTWTVASPDASLAGGTARHLVASPGGDLVAFGSIPGATADQGQVWLSARKSGSVCLDAIAAARIGHSGSTVTFTDPTTGATEHLVLPAGLRTRVVNDRGELLAPDGTVIGSEGDVLTLGGGGSPFAVCTVNGVNYLGS